MPLQTHPLAQLFRAMTDQEFAKLKADIAQWRFIEPIWLYQRAILDGRHRCRACQELGVKCPTREYLGDNPLAFISLNVSRRPLDESQRAMIAAKLANLRCEDTLKQHRRLNSDDDHTPPMTLQRAAETMKVGRDTVAKAKTVLKEAPPEVVEAVESGHRSIHSAYQALRPLKPRDMARDHEPAATAPLQRPLIDGPEDADAFALDTDPPENGYEWENWIESLEDITERLTAMLESIHERGGLDAVLKTWPPQRTQDLVACTKQFGEHWAGFVRDLSAVAETITLS
jgi:ParB-like chromosome segregation protein Spo0J